MSIKKFLARLVAKLTGRKCSRCAYNCGGKCAHPSDGMFMKCWHGITKPGFKERQAQEDPAPGDLTEEEKHQLGKIVETLQVASATAKDGGLLADIAGLGD